MQFRRRIAREPETRSAKNRGWILSVAAATVAAVVFGGASIAASAQTRPARPAATPLATVQYAGQSFYTDADIDAAWQQATSTFPDPMPTGVAFPKTAPALFHPNDGKKHIFETDLLTEIAARYWRCAWVDTELKAAASPTKALSAAEQTEATNELSPATWSAIPDVVKNLDVKSYLANVAAYAARNDLSANAAEMQLSCNVYPGGGK